MAHLHADVDAVANVEERLLLLNKDRPAHPWRGRRARQADEAVELSRAGDRAVPEREVLREAAEEAIRAILQRELDLLSRPEISGNLLEGRGEG